MTGKKVHRRRDRDRDRPAARHLRALAWHASAAGNHALCASVFSRRATSWPRWPAPAPARGVRRRRARAGVAFDDSSSGRVFVRRIVRRIVPGGVLGRVGARLSLLDGRGVAGAGLEHGDRDADDPHEQIGRAARVAPRRAGGGFGRDATKRRRAGAPDGRTRGRGVGDERRARMDRRARRRGARVGAREAMVRRAEESLGGHRRARPRARERGAREDFKRRVLRRFRGVSLRGRRRRLRRLPPSIVRGPGEAREGRRRALRERERGAGRPRGDPASALARGVRSRRRRGALSARAGGDLAHAASVCADVASFELERRGGGGGARRDGGDERVASLAAHRAKEIDAWRAAATLPGGGDRGNEKKFEVSGLNKSKSSPDVAVPPRAPPSRGGVRAGRGPRRGPRGVRRGRRDPHGRPRGGPPRARRRHARGGGGGRRRRRGRRRRGGD